ncbi:ATP-binding protein [Azospirillum sp.]|uniref:ATP-binding protein n=1 Tax=Azospirillum sp. TaxID=34012 RepID=UPI003D702E99
MNRRRPLVLLVLAALLPLVVLSATLSTAWLMHLQDEMRDGAFEQVDRVAALLDRELAAQIEVLRALAQSPLLDGAVDEAAFATLAERVRQGRPLWRRVSLSDPEGNRLVDVPGPVGGRMGKVVEPDSHARIVQTRRPVIGPIVRGPRHTAFAIRVPVQRGDRLPYVLSAVVMPDGVRGLLDHGLPPGWVAAVVDSEGLVVATSRGGNPDHIGRKASDGALAARAAAAKGLYDGPNTINGHATKVAYRVLPDSFWSVHVGIPRDMYTAPFVRAVWLLAGGAVLSLLLVASFLWLLAREMRTRRAEEAALEEGRRMEALGRMTGGVAHDFNNLLMIAQGGAESIRNRPHDTERVVRYADAILTAVQRGEALTRQLLAFARRSPQEPVSFLLQDRADELLTLLSRSTRADIAVTLAVPAELWPIFADPDGLEVALVNLAVNARDAMPGGGRLDIDAENVTLAGGRRVAGLGGDPLGGDYVVVRVRDTGTGIRAEDLGRIFEPFYTTKAVGKGTGLGLSQVMGYARQSGGAVTADSRLGEGTTFTLYLPRAVQPPVRPARRTDETVSDDAGRILLVEDNPEVARAAEGMLAAAGHRVTWAPSGPAALARIDAGEAFDAVLSDIVMEGGLSGLELAQRLRERRPALPIVLMTGYSEALAAGVPDGLSVLSKPFGQAEALAALRSARANARRETMGTA